MLKGCRKTLQLQNECEIQVALKVNYSWSTYGHSQGDVMMLETEHSIIQNKMIFALIRCVSDFNSTELRLCFISYVN